MLGKELSREIGSLVTACKRLQTTADPEDVEYIRSARAQSLHNDRWSFESVISFAGEKIDEWPCRTEL